MNIIKVIISIFILMNIIHAMEESVEIPPALDKESIMCVSRENPGHNTDIKPIQDITNFPFAGETLKHIFSFSPTSRGCFLLVCARWRDVILSVQGNEHVCIETWSLPIAPFDLDSTRRGLLRLKYSFLPLRSQDGSCFFITSFITYMSSHLTQHKNHINGWVENLKKVGVVFVESTDVDNRSGAFSLENVITAEKNLKSHLFFTSHVNLGNFILNILISCKKDLENEQGYRFNLYLFDENEYLSLLKEYNSSKEYKIFKEAATLYKAWRGLHANRKSIMENDNKVSFGRLLMSNEIIFDRSTYIKDDKLLQQQFTQLATDLHAYLAPVDRSYRELLWSLIH